jgi:hypothetical protein
MVDSERAFRVEFLAFNFVWKGLQKAESLYLALFLVPLCRNGAKFFLRFFEHFCEHSANIFSKCELQKCSSHFD